MSYIDYNFYSTEYKGSLITSTEFANFEFEAESIIDMFTLSRLTENGFPEESNYVKRIKWCVCKVCDCLKKYSKYDNSTSIKIEDNGGIVKSVKSGDESISYVATKTDLTSIKHAKDSEISNIIFTGLADIPDADGTNLLYRGF